VLEVEAAGLLVAQQRLTVAHLLEVAIVLEPGGRELSALRCTRSQLGG
jgi:hypothetical protein